MLYTLELIKEFEQRERWRQNPDIWCRERLNFEPSWEVLTARSLNMSIEEFKRKHGGEIKEKQIEVLYSLRDNQKTLVRSGHQVGKTIVTGAATLWFLDCFRPSRVLTTSATWSDVKMKLWGQIRSLYRSNGSWMGQLINDTSLRINDRHYALGLSTEQVEPFQGHNDKHVLVAFDEASAIMQKFFDAADAEATRMLATGNPLLTAGPFYKYSKSSEWNKIHISCFDHPNIIYKREVIPGGPRLEWVESRLRCWGAKSPLYLSRVLGEFPEEAEDSWFPISIIQASFNLYREIESLPSDPDSEVVLGLDVARAGGDATVGYKRDTVTVDGKKIKRVKRIIKLKKTEHHRTRMIVGDHWQVEKFNHANIDAGGEGSGLADEVSAMGYKVNRIMFGSSAGDHDCENKRSEIYRQLSVGMKAYTIALEPDDELEEELAVIGGAAAGDGGLKEKSVAGTRRIVFALPPKEDMRESLGGRSTDNSDGAGLANYEYVESGISDYYDLLLARRGQQAAEARA